jgi:hypothetical protein
MIILVAQIDKSISEMDKSIVLTLTQNWVFVTWHHKERTTHILLPQ